MLRLCILSVVLLHKTSALVDETVNPLNNEKNVSGLSLELQRLQSELRAVASIASQCADAKEAVRQHENDHTILYWIKDSIGELRHELRELEIKVSSTNPFDTQHFFDEVRDRLGREIRVLRHEMYDMKVREATQEAQMESEIFERKVQSSTSFQNNTANYHHNRWVKKFDVKLKNIKSFLKRLQKKQKHLEKSVWHHEKFFQTLRRKLDTDPLESGFKLSGNRIDSLTTKIAEIITQRDVSSKKVERVEAVIKELIHELKLDLEARQTLLIKKVLEIS